MSEGGLCTLCHIPVYVQNNLQINVAVRQSPQFSYRHDQLCRCPNDVQSIGYQ